ncbi:MAG TPA: prenyltransferase [Candidatus Limnocylindria bacterium]|nr:prenyltransferase [Candidatus Limnocylindria bacterium]
MNVAMWVQALRVIPRISREEWDRLDVVSRWLIAARGAVLVITFISAGLAGLLAIRDGGFDATLWALTTIALLLAHATNNLVNDWTDYRKGVDRNNYFRAQYGPHPLEHGLMSEKTLLRYAAASGGLALAIGAYLVAARGPLALALLAAGAFFVLFYTYPLKYIGLGELAVLVVWGPLMIGGTYFISTGRWDWTVALAGLPYALGATGVIFGKHVDKYAEDRAKGIATLPVLIGERAARVAIAAMLLGQYALVAYLVATGFFTPLLLVVFLAAPQLRSVLAALRHPKPSERPADYPANAWPIWFVGHTFLHNRRWGSLFLLGLIGEVVARQLLR